MVSLPVQSASQDNSTMSAGIIICNGCLVLTYHHMICLLWNPNRTYIRICTMYIAAFEWSIFRNGEFSSSVFSRRENDSSESACSHHQM